MSDRDIRACAREGACSVGEVGRACDAGTGCGGCRPEIASILDSERQATSASLTGMTLLPVLQAV